MRNEQTRYPSIPVRFLIVAVAVIMTLCAAASPALARQIYVNNQSGDDQFNGRQAQPTPGGEGPFRTIGAALEVAGPSDEVYIANTGVPYHESITLGGKNRSGIEGFPFRLIGDGAVLDGSVPVPEEAWEHFKGPTFRFQPKGQHFNLLFLDGRPAAEVIVPIEAGGPPELNAFEWCHTNGYIYFRCEDTKLPSDYNLSYAKLDTGITLYHVNHVDIMDLTIQGFRVDGISAINTAREVTLVGCTMRGCGRSGLTVGGASIVSVNASLIGNNGRSQILTLPSSKTIVRNSNILGNTAPAWVDKGGLFYEGDFQIKGGREVIKPEGADEEEPAKQ